MTSRLNIRWSRWLALALAAVVGIAVIRLAVVPAVEMYTDRIGTVDGLRAEIFRLHDIERSLPTRRKEAAEVKGRYQAANQSFHKLSANAAGAALERMLVEKLKSKQLVVRQSRVLQATKVDALEFASVAIAFSASHEALLATMSELPQLKPTVFVDSLRVALEPRINLGRGVGEDADGGPYRKDPILGVELIVRALVEPSEGKS